MADVFKIKKLKPLFNQIVVTRNLYDEQKTKSGVILAAKTHAIKEYQTVVAVGPHVQGIEPGDVVFIDPKRYMQVEHNKDGGIVDKEKNIIKDNMHATFAIPTFDVYDQPDGKCRQLMLIGDNDIYFVAEGAEEDDGKKEPSVIDKVPLIVSAGNKIIS